MRLKSSGYMVPERLSFHFPYNVPWYREVFNSDEVQFIFFFFCCSFFLCHIYKLLANPSPCNLSFSFLLRIFSLLVLYLGHWSVLSWLLYMMWGKLEIYSLSCEWISTGLSTICWRDYSLHWLVLAPSSKMNWSHMCDSSHPVLFHVDLVICIPFHFNVRWKLAFLFLKKKIQESNTKSIPCW